MHEWPFSARRTYEKVCIHTGRSSGHLNPQVRIECGSRRDSVDASVPVSYGIAAADIRCPLKQPYSYHRVLKRPDKETSPRNPTHR